MDARQERGRQIADRCRIENEGNFYTVPLQSGRGKYAVRPDKPSCTCPDFEERGGLKCKHLFAVEFSLTRVHEDAKGNVTVEEVTVTAKAVRMTYAQPNWPQYHASQVNEKRHFQDLLSDLCSTLAPPAPKRGRPVVHTADAAI